MASQSNTAFPTCNRRCKDVGLRGIFSDLIPIVEFTWSSPSSSPSAVGTTWIAAPGVIYLTSWGEVGLEALIPLNKAAGPNVGAVGLIHFFFDDLFPNTIGKPIFN